MSLWEGKPTPGSNEALEEGCKCPILDNAHGRGMLGGGIFVVNAECPLHAAPEGEEE